MEGSLANTTTTSSSGTLTMEDLKKVFELLPEKEVAPGWETISPYELAQRIEEKIRASKERGFVWTEKH
jgi:hypothetical protein